MANANIYSKVIELKKLSINELEQLLGLGNGAIGKAIKRNSSIKPAVLAKLSEEFPDIDFPALEVELLQAGNKSIKKQETTLQEPPINYGAPDLTTALVQFLTSQAGRDEMFMRTANAATEAAQATVQIAQEVKGIASSIQNLQGAVELNGDEITAVKVWVSKYVGPLVKQGYTQIEDELDMIALEAAELRKEGKAPSVGKKHKQQAKSHQS